jgi:hypothetical protein
VETIFIEDIGFLQNLQKQDASAEGKLFPGRNICSKSEIKYCLDVRKII